MDNSDKRKFNRYDAFIQLTLSVPVLLGKDAFDVTGWIKNVSQDGIALEVYILSSDEIEPLLELAANQQLVTALIPLPDDASIRAECKIVWGAFSENKKLYTMGLLILAINPLQKHKWDAFIEKLAQ